MKGHCIKALKMLLSCGIEDLHDDGFEGSVHETRIFGEVFFGHESGIIGGCSKYVETDAINFENDKKMPKDISFSSDSGSSVMTNQEDFQKTKEDFEEYALVARNDPDVEVKRRKVSPGDLFETNFHLEKVVQSSIPSNAVDSNSNDQKTCDVSKAIISSPVSEGSHASKLLDTMPEPVQCYKKKWKDSSFIELDKDEFLVPPKDSSTGPKPLLRYHTYCLLVAAGWLIGRRNRISHNKGIGEYIFKTPEGRPIREFYRAWSMCGQRLVEDSKFVGVCDSIRWKDFTQFLSDLSAALIEVEKLRNWGSPIALAHWWYLLDPFAKVVFVDRSLPYLKQGKEVKAERSVLISLYLKKNNTEKVYHSGSSKKSVRCKKSIKHQKEKQGNRYLRDDDLILSALLSNQYTNKQSGTKKSSHVQRVVRKYKSKKGSCRLLPRSFGKCSGLDERTVLCWLINLGVIRLNEAIQYRNPKDNSLVKDGLVTRNGILCQCCKKVLSVTEFKSHAGFSTKNPCLNLFMESGKSFTLCQLEAWSAEYKVRKGATQPTPVVYYDENDPSDDSCGLCGDGGELICCDNCPSTFHQACLSTQELPEGNWYCPMCCCWSCGNAVNHIEASAIALKCVQCNHKYHGECIKENRIDNGLTGPNWFCGETCEKIHSSLSSWIGFVNPISDGFSWTLLRCIHGDQKVHSAQNFVAFKAECNLKLAVALTIMEECFLPMVDTRTGIHIIPHVLYNWGSEYVRLNYEGFYTVVLEKNDIMLCVASLRIHGATVAEMPLIATCSRYRRLGMCRRLMNAIEEILKAFKVEKLVVSAIPSLVETWTHGFGFSPLEADEKKSLEKTNLMVFPGTVWLKKPMYQHGSTQCTAVEAVASDLNDKLEEDTSLVDVMPVYDMKYLQAMETIRIGWWNQ